jgi:prepilin-type N-terminal cleavage/methylation domain-containing protein
MLRAKGTFCEPDRAAFGINGESSRVRKHAGFTLIELLIVVAVIGVIAGIAVPGLLRARMAGNEASAISSLRVINSAQLNYITNCAFSLGYSPSTANLATPPLGGGQSFLSPDLAAPSGVPLTKSGFNVTYTAGAAVAAAPATCNGAAAGTVVSTYLTLADPTVWGSSGNRHFATSEAQTIFQEISNTPISAISASGVPTPNTATALR